MIRNIALILACFFAAHANAAQKPNIIFIFADDLGYGDLGCYGHPYAKTPALDQLAKEGTRFTQAYVTGVTCCPSRTGMMTGKYPATFAKYMSDHGFGDRVTITELLNKNGYRTGHFGKWHIGPETKNGTYGIDVINGDKRRDAKDRAKRGRDAPVIDGAIRFLEANANTGKPIYMNVWGHISHFPVRSSKAFSERFKDVVVDESKFNATMREKFQHCRELRGDIDEGMRNYLGDVWNMDAGIGRLLKKVDELGLRKNTIVVFSSDHGPAPVKLGGGRNEAPSRIDAARNMLGSPGLYRGGKHTQFEGGVRVPFIVRWPDHVPAGRVNETSVISFIDWLPTICKLTGTKNTAPNLDGENVSDIWLGAKRTRTKPLFWRVGNVNARPAVRIGDWKYYHYNNKQTGPMLYNLAKDPGEKRNLVKENPQVVRRLTNQINDWIATLPKEYTKPNKQKKRDKKK
mgnify:FL=1